MCQLVLFRPGLACKPRLWLGLRELWPPKFLSQAKALTGGTAQARPGLGQGLGAGKVDSKQSV